MTTTHYKTALWQTACGATSGGIFFCYSEARHEVTCKRCLASLAKRDREFQRKARRRFARTERRWEPYARAAIKAQRPKWFAEDAARAIAREEGLV